MNEVFYISDNFITSLGFDTQSNILSIHKNQTGITKIDDTNLWIEPFYASKINFNDIDFKFKEISVDSSYSKYEKLSILSAYDAINKSKIDVTKEDTIFIISTTKGNIDCIEEQNSDSSEFLFESAKKITRFFGNKNVPFVISNACISGVLAIITAERLLRAGKFKNAVIIGADILTEFVVSGFQSFKSLSYGPCKPFDKERDGLSLGEGAGTIILSTENIYNSNIKVLKGASANDSNHISGPSRTGEGLYLSIVNSLKYSGLNPCQIQYISAHGTATPFNDEMESIAISRAELNNAYINSYKGYFGHTLGAAGIIESIISVYSLKNNILFKSLGFNIVGVKENVKILEKNIDVELKNILKLSSGFGGCNAAIIFSKHE